MARRGTSAHAAHLVRSIIGTRDERARTAPTSPPKPKTANSSPSGYNTCSPGVPAPSRHAEPPPGSHVTKILDRLIEHQQRMSNTSTAIAVVTRALIPGSNCRQPTGTATAQRALYSHTALPTTDCAQCSTTAHPLIAKSRLNESSPSS